MRTERGRGRSEDDFSARRVERVLGGGGRSELTEGDAAVAVAVVYWHRRHTVGWVVVADGCRHGLVERRGPRRGCSHGDDLCMLCRRLCCGLRDVRVFVYLSRLGVG